MTPSLAPSPTSGTEETPDICPHCGGSVVSVQGLFACHDCDWTADR